MSAATIPVTRFTTDAFAPADRHQAWVHRDWPAIGPVFETRPTAPFHNRSDRFALGGVSVHVADMGAQRYTRSARKARADGMDQLMMTLMLSGAAAGDADGVDVGIGAGGASFVDLSLPHAHASTDSRTILLSVPRVTAEREGLDVRALHGTSIGAGATTLLRDHVLGIHAALPSLAVTASPRLERSVLDLLCVAVEGAGSTQAASPPSRDTATFLSAQRLIAARLASPDLSSDWLCARLQVSRSTLYRLFAEQGGVGGYIRDRRLDRVAETLAAGSPTIRIADLAERWGFSDPSHLSRAFRERFGSTPSDYRAVSSHDEGR
jgi:AraC-like DNA-binding protein